MPGYHFSTSKGHDLSDLSPEAFDGGEHRGLSQHPSEFPIRLANLRWLAADVGLDQVAGVLPGIGSRFLGFRRATALSDHVAEQLCAELIGLYSDVPPEAAQMLARLIIGRAWPLIRYMES